MRVFIGSSSEQRSLVDWLTKFIRSSYASEIEPVPWTIPWPGGQFTIENLLSLVNETDAAILFWTPDDKTWYRDSMRKEPRDNLVFEAGLFMATHGRDRAQLMIPRYELGDQRTEVAIPSDLAGMLRNEFEWVDGPVDATGLPDTARRVCDSLKRLGARPRKPAVLAGLKNRPNVTEVTTFVGEWLPIVDIMSQIAKSPSTRSIDLLAAYNAGTISQALTNIKTCVGAKLRVCFANMFDDELLRCYRRKYTNRSKEEIVERLKQSIESLLGPCRVEAASRTEIRVGEISNPPKAQYEIRLTNQRITFGYCRVEGVASIMPLDMKTSHYPAPLAWVLDNETAPVVFDHYLMQYEAMFDEALCIYCESHRKPQDQEGSMHLSHIPESLTNYGP